LKIAFITLTSTIPFGSCDLLNFRTAKLAHEQGHEVLLSVNDFSDLHHKNYRDIEAAGVKVDKRPMPDITGFVSRITYKIKDKLLSPDRHFKNCFAFKPDYIFVNNQGNLRFCRQPACCLAVKNRYSLRFTVAAQSRGERAAFRMVPYGKNNIYESG